METSSYKIILHHCRPHHYHPAYQVVQHYSHRALDDDMRSQMALDWIAREQVSITKTMMVKIKMMMVMVMTTVSGDPGDNCTRVEPGRERP